MTQPFCFPTPPVSYEFILNPAPNAVPRTGEKIYEEIWKLSPYVHAPESYRELVGLTNELKDLYESQGRLVRDPFESARQRAISLDDDVSKELKNSTCLVTGGLGCVGSMLVQELVKLKAKKIVILDLKALPIKVIQSTRIVSLSCDVRDVNGLQDIFSICSPDYVFHTAAQRDPGLAEMHVMETVSTNVLGTFNVIKACEATRSVKQMVFSSTGKASRYFTEEVYAASKKMAEFLLTAYANQSRIKYSMVRFTHILDNSLMNIALEEESKCVDHLSVHSPGKYVTAQNVQEAVSLMLNALVYSEKKYCNLLLVRHLDWPVESLEVALYYIKRSGRQMPVIFGGNPLGYSEKFFRGQFDWSRPEEMNLLTNVYERKSRKLSSSEEIIISRGCAIDKCVVDKAIDQIAHAHGEDDSKRVLVRGLKELVRDSLKYVDKEETASILRWGLDPQYIEAEKVNVAEFSTLISLLVESLAGSEYDQETDDLVYQLL